MVQPPEMAFEIATTIEAAHNILVYLCMHFSHEEIMVNDEDWFALGTSDRISTATANVAMGLCCLLFRMPLGTNAFQNGLENPRDFLRRPSP